MRDVCALNMSARPVGHASVWCHLLFGFLTACFKSACRLTCVMSMCILVYLHRSHFRLLRFDLQGMPVDLGILVHIAVRGAPSRINFAKKCVSR